MRIHDEVIVFKNSKGEVLIETHVTSKARRTSMYTAASWRQIDMLLKNHPTAVSGFIGRPLSEGPSRENNHFVVTPFRRSKFVEKPADETAT